MNCKRKITYKNKIFKITDTIFSRHNINLEQNWNFNKKFSFFKKNNIQFKKCSISFSDNISNDKIHYEKLNHYKFAKNQLRIRIPLKRHTNKNVFKYFAELKLHVL